MALPLPEGYDLDTVFRLAGFPRGRPKITDIPQLSQYQGASWETIVNLFTDELINILICEVVRVIPLPISVTGNIAFNLLLASKILSQTTCMGYTPQGRSLDTFSIRLGEYVEEFVSSEAAIRIAREIAGDLARRAIALFEAQS